MFDYLGPQPKLNEAIAKVISLTTRQRNQLIYSLYKTKKLTLTELGDAIGISRQRIHQLILRCEKLEKKAGQPVKPNSS